MYALVKDRLGFAPAGVPDVKLYTDAGALSASVALNLKAVAGWNEPGEAIKLANPSWPAARATLAHELTHFVVFARHGAGEKRIPWWLHEGLAQYVASGEWTERARREYLGRSSAWARQEALVAWARMANYDETPTDLWPHVYAQGYAFARYVTETYGMGSLTAFMTVLSDGGTVDAASGRAFGKSFAALDADLRGWLARTD